MKKPPSYRVSEGPMINTWEGEKIKVLISNQVKNSRVTCSRVSPSFFLHLTSHLKMSLSSMSPAENPSTGFLLSSASCFLRSREACDVCDVCEDEFS